jgi:hypothetical protein
MKTIARYNEARKEIESRFLGLPHAHISMLGYLINRADPETGIVDDISHRDLGLMLTVDSAPGRRGAGTPQKQTIRSYLITIAEQCKKDFKILSQGQKLRVQFLTFPEIYNNHFARNKVSTDERAVLNTDKPIETADESVMHVACSNASSDSEVCTETPTPCDVKNIYKTNNNNKINEKLRIADDFMPNPETMTRATSLGIDFADDLNEIQAFIDHNKAIGSLWADFNPIYLRWLARSAERKQKTSHDHKESQHARSSRKPHQPSARERVLNAHREAFQLCEETGRLKERTGYATGYDSHLMASAY